MEAKDKLSGITTFEDKADELARGYIGGSDRSVATYVCHSCGKRVTVDDFDADFGWNWRHYGNTP